MEIINEFLTPNREYKIRISREKNLYNISEYGKYKCNIDFIDSIGRTIVHIQCNEKEFLNIFHDMFVYVSETVYGNNSGLFTVAINSNYFFYISEDELSNNHPIDDDEEIDPSLCIFIYEGNGYNNILRISFSSKQDWIFSVFLDSIFRTIQDLDYISEMNKSYMYDKYSDLYYHKEDIY